MTEQRPKGIERRQTLLSFEGEEVVQNRNGPRPEETRYTIDGTSEVSSGKDCATGYFHHVNNVS